MSDAGFQQADKVLPEGLSTHDAQALDALIEAGWDPERVAPMLRGAARSIAGVLGLLDAPVMAVGGDALIDATIARTRPITTENVSLQPRDEDALEALVGAGWDAARVPSSLRANARRQLDLLDLLATAPPTHEARERLVDRTLARVQHAIDNEERMLGVPAWDARPRSGFQLADLISVAAVVLIGSAVLWPMLSDWRAAARQTACLANFAAVGSALGLYAGDNRDSLPMASASIAGNPWFHVGRNPEESNSANLYTLARERYAMLASLACPGNPSAREREPAPNARDWRCLEEVSYSYQNLFAHERPRWNTPGMVILADRSPVTLNGVCDRIPYPLPNSPNHNRAGQHVLMADGSSSWLASAVLPNGDQIWLPRAYESALSELTGRETPAGADDVFLIP